MSRLLSPRAGARPPADLGERSVLIAGQRVGRARRRRPRIRDGLRRVGGPGLALLAAATALAAGIHWLSTDPMFVVTAIEVQGAERMTPGQVAEAAAIVPGTSIFQIRPGEIAARVAALPAVRRAEVVRELPARVVVVLEERRPFTLVHAGRLMWIDEEGAVLGEVRQAVAAPLPLISGLAPGELGSGSVADGPRGRAAIALLRTLLRTGSALGEAISEIDMARGDGPVLRTLDGVEVRLGEDDWPDRLARVEAVLAQVAAHDPNVRVVDLRFRDQVVLSSWDPPTGEQSAAPRTPGRGGHP